MTRVAFTVSLLCFFFAARNAFSQKAPDTLWEHCYGGTYQDQAQSAQPTSDGGSIVLGSTGSNDHDVSGNHGGVDYWLLKLDKAGKIQWQKCLGGIQDDYGWGRVQQTTDGGYIVCGFSYSKDTTVSQVTGNHGGPDYWVVKLDANGNIKWEQSLGGSGDDASYSVRQTRDGGYIVAGSTDSNDGQVGLNHGKIDAWIVKLSDSGKIQWKRTYGGTGYDAANDIIQTREGGFVAVGYTTSTDSNLAGRTDTSSTDLWAFKLDSIGNVKWSKWYGGSGEDEGISVKPTHDGGMIIAGYTTSNDRDVSGYHDSSDFWLLRLDQNGSIVWQKCLGGSGRDTANDVIVNKDGSLIATGFTTSNDYDVNGNHGDKDMWVVKTDSAGKLIWQKCLGGSRSDGAFSIAPSGDSAYLLAGWSYSHNDGDVHGHHNWSGVPKYDIDAWVVKLDFASIIVDPPGFGGLAIWPNPAHDIITISGTSRKPYEFVMLYNILGQTVYKQSNAPDPFRLKVEGIKPGIYTIEINDEGRIVREKLVIQ